MPFPIVLTLTRFAPRMRRQEGDVLEFQADRLLVKKAGAVILEFPYLELHRLRYFHFPTNMSRTLQWMGGNLFQRREAHFRVETGNERHEFWLESDLEFRTNDLRELFRTLYENAVPLEEISHTGNRLLLLQAVGAEEWKEKVAAMREG